jgi:hypothetical protein
MSDGTLEEARGGICLRSIRVRNGFWAGNRTRGRGIKAAMGASRSLPT